MVRTALASFKTLPNAIVVLPELAKFLDKIFEEIEEIAIRLSMGAVTTQPISCRNHQIPERDTAPNIKTFHNPHRSIYQKSQQH